MAADSFLWSPSLTERQHLGSVPDHLSSIHTQQLAPGVQPLRAQIQGESLSQWCVKGPVSYPLPAKTDALLDLCLEVDERLAGGIVTSLGEVSLPFATS